MLGTKAHFSIYLINADIWWILENRVSILNYKTSFQPAKIRLSRHAMLCPGGGEREKKGRPKALFIGQSMIITFISALVVYSPP